MAKAVGRKPKVLQEDEVAQVEALASVLSVEQIADYFGMAKPTFYQIMERQPEVYERYKRGKSKAIGAVAQGLLTQAREGNLTAAIFYLKTQAKWRETDRVELTGADGEAINVQKITREIIDPKHSDG